MKVTVLHPQLGIVFHCDDGATAAFIELWAPGAGPDEITVTWRGLDVFRTPAPELLERIRALGSSASGSTRRLGSPVSGSAC